MSIANFLICGRWGREQNKRNTKTKVMKVKGELPEQE
jgi:hypothetical protein